MNGSLITGTLSTGSKVNDAPSSSTILTVDPCHFVDDVPDHFICCICHEVPLEPLEHNNRDHCHVILCKKCKDSLIGSLSRSAVCPQCRQGNVSVEFTPMHRVLRVKYFETMLIRCPQEGCNKHVPLSNYVKHVEHECDAVIVTCPVDNCGYQASKSDMARHLLESGIDHVKEMLSAHYKLVRSNETLISNSRAKMTSFRMPVLTGYPSLPPMPTPLQFIGSPESADHGASGDY